MRPLARTALFVIALSAANAAAAQNSTNPPNWLDRSWHELSLPQIPGVRIAYRRTKPHASGMGVSWLVRNLTDDKIALVIARDLFAQGKFVHRRETKVWLEPRQKKDGGHYFGAGGNLALFDTVRYHNSDLEKGEVVTRVQVRVTFENVSRAKRDKDDAGERLVEERTRRQRDRDRPPERGAGPGSPQRDRAAADADLARKQAERDAERQRQDEARRAREQEHEKRVLQGLEARAAGYGAALDTITASLDGFARQHMTGRMRARGAAVRKQARANLDRLRRDGGDVCRECSGTGFEACDECERGLRTCTAPRCDGGSTACASCRGSGVFGRGVACPICLGRGKSSCSTCFGGGRIVCEECGGAASRECQRCGGEGRR